jgi:hypothetical protein
MNHKKTYRLYHEVEHYTVTAVLHGIIEGPSPAAIAAEAIEGGLLTRLDHAADRDREPAPSSGACRCEAGDQRACDSASGG